MPKAVYVPRVNNNDDEVQVRALHVGRGDRVDKDQNVGEVETDKAVVEIEAEKAGYILEVYAEEGDTLTVGNILMWIGESADEAVPEAQETSVASTEQNSVAPTAKAKLLLKKYGLRAEQITITGDRLSVANVQAHIDTNNSRPVAAEHSAPTVPHTNYPPPAAAGSVMPMTPEQKGMLGTVTWHRDEAVAGYIELEYDTGPWEAYADAYAKEHKLLMSPLIPLMSYQLVEIIRANKAINTTILNGERFEYENINLGFTVQVGKSLYLPVLREAETLDTHQFLLQLGELQRKANGHKLSAHQLEGATVSFSSMARWQINRHMPILPPYTSLIIAHAVTKKGKSAIGASYDHRVLSGFDVTMVLKALIKPPAN